MLQTKRYLYVGFMCHQTIEKALKGYFVSVNDENRPHNHNLTYLAKKPELYEQLSEEQMYFLDLLEPLNIEARYPTHKENILNALNYERCQDIILKTKELAEWIGNKL